jgi:hypothetical protein
MSPGIDDVAAAGGENGHGPFGQVQLTERAASYLGAVETHFGCVVLIFQVGHAR